MSTCPACHGTGLVAQLLIFDDGETRTGQHTPEVACPVCAIRAAINAEPRERWHYRGITVPPTGLRCHHWQIDPTTARPGTLHENLYWPTDSYRQATTEGADQ